MNPSENEYDKVAAVYDRRWHHYVDASVRHTIAALRLEGNERVLDVGCGTGALLHELARTYPGLRLHGVDPSARMLDRAREKCGGKATLERGHAESLPYPENEFDLVVSVSAAHFFSDVPRALAEMRRVLRPNGRLVITDWCADFPAMRLLAAWLRLRGAALGRVFREREFRKLLDESGFAIESADRFRIRPLWGMVRIGARNSTVDFASPLVQRFSMNTAEEEMEIPVELSVKDYLQQEEAAATRHEYVNGRIYAMSGGSRDHELIAGNIFAALHAHLRGGPCSVFRGGLKVRIEAAGDDVFYYPDVVVTCDPSDRERYYLTRPVVIFEVLSPSTERLDRREKFFAYRQLSSLDAYVLVAQHTERVEVYSPSGDWSAAIQEKDGALELPTLKLSLPLSQIYAGVEFTR